MPEVASLTAAVGPSRAGSPTTYTAPSTAPVIDPRPPMTTMPTMASESAGAKASGPNCTVRPASSAPAKAAIAPGRAKATSFVLDGEIPNEAAARSLSRTAMMDRPTPLRRSRLVSTTATTRPARQTR